MSVNNSKLAVLVLMLACSCTTYPDTALNPAPSDPGATSMASALFSNLLKISRDHVLLGHQDALAYGIGWKGEPFRTDINDVLGDHPAVPDFIEFMDHDLILSLSELPDLYNQN